MTQEQEIELLDTVKVLVDNDARILRILENDDAFDEKGLVSQVKTLDKRVADLEFSRKFLMGLVSIAVFVGGGLWSLITWAYDKFVS